MIAAFKHALGARDAFEDLVQGKIDRMEFENRGYKLMQIGQTMLKLSIDAINLHSPYSLRLSEEGSFCFTTDEALVYEVGFIED